MKEALLIISCIILIIALPSILNCMLRDQLKRFESDCKRIIKEKDEEYNKQEKLNNAIKRWLFR